MGQATVDLPDPPSATPTGPSPSADDLLAQLAGAEIDRLLAEAEIERKAAEDQTTTEAPPPAVAAAATEAPAVPPEASAPATHAPGHGRAKAAAIEVTPEIESQLDDLFKQLNEAAELIDPVKSSDIVSPPEPKATAGETAATPAQAAASAQPPETLVAAKAEPPAAARKAAEDSLASGAAAAPPASAAAALAAEIEADAAQRAVALAQAVSDAPGTEEDPEGEIDGEDDDRPSLLVRLLEVVNRPLARCSDRMRAIMGKVAIATLINAVAVIGYVIVFRRHR